MSIRKEIVRKLSHVYVTVAVLALMLLVRIGYLQTAERSKWEEQGRKLTYKDLTIEARRGNIMARDGQILASSVPHYEIRMDPLSNIPAELFYEKIDSLGIALADLFYPASDPQKKGKKIANELINARKEGDRYHFIQRNVSYQELEKLKKFPILQRGRYKGGLIAIQETKRLKPFRKLASRTIGRLKNDVETHNVVGLEGAYNSYLKGKDGIKLVRRLSGGAWMPLEQENAVEPVHGMDLVSSIDISYQDVAENALEKQLRKHKAHHGSAILMKVKTGEILAMANLADTSGNGSYHELYNYAIGERTEPGSTFKLASLIAAFEDGYIDLLDTIDTGNGVIRYYGFPVRDTKRGGWGELTVKKVFQVSSNVGVSKIIYEHYKNQPERFVNRLYSMNLGSSSGIELKGEPSPYIKYPDNQLWSGISLPQMAIGYEVMLTPLQMLTFYNAVANSGKMVRPRLGKRIEKRGRLVRRFKTEIVNPAICSRQTIEKVQMMLEAVVEKGTARNIRNSNYKIAGKTGTAQLAYNKEGYGNKENKTRYQASFAGYFPADNPEYSCIVVINSPSNSVYYGSAVAAPVVKEMADKVYARSLELHKLPAPRPEQKKLKIPYSKCGNKDDLKYVLENFYIPVQHQDTITTSNVRTIKRNQYIELHPRPVKDKLVPNVLGMGAMDAVALLEKRGMKVDMKGRGMVVEQSMQPGAVIKPGQVIRLQMSKTD